jgi:hypothetical protein
MRNLGLAIGHLERMHMSKVHINDLARDMEVKCRLILEILAELGLGSGKTHSSTLEDYESEKVRAHLASNKRPVSRSEAAASRATQAIVPKIDLSHTSKPRDVLMAIRAKLREGKEEARQSHSLTCAQSAPPAPVMPAPSVVVTPQGVSLEIL